MSHATPNTSQPPTSQGRAGGFGQAAGAQYGWGSVRVGRTGHLRLA